MKTWCFAFEEATEFLKCYVNKLKASKDKGLS
jgi:hypothetical protein